MQTGCFSASVERRTAVVYWEMGGNRRGWFNGRLEQNQPVAAVPTVYSRTW